VGGWGVKKKKKKLTREPTQRSTRVAAAAAGRSSPPPSIGTSSPPRPSTEANTAASALPPNASAPPCISAAAADPDNAHEQFLDSQEDFNVPRSWWQGRESSCEDDDLDDEEDSDMNVEGGGLEEILNWPLELLHACNDHSHRGKKRKGATRVEEVASDRRSRQVHRGVGREENERGEASGVEVGTSEGTLALGDGIDPAWITGALGRGGGSGGLRWDATDVGGDAVRGGEPDANFGGPSWVGVGFRAEKEGSHVEEAEFSLHDGEGLGPGGRAS
jgi:hypothetical protein